MRLLFLLAFPVLLFSCGTSPAPQAMKPVQAKKAPVKKGFPLKEGLTEATELFKSSKTPYEPFKSQVGDSFVYCSYKGMLEIHDSGSRYVRPLFNLKVEFLVDKIFVARLDKRQWFVFWQETDHEGVLCSAAVYHEGDNKPEWKRIFRSPNPGIPVLDGPKAYISTLGMVACIELADGGMAWKQDSLYNQYSRQYQKFEKAIVTEDKVLFVDYPIPGRRETRDTLELDPVSGKRLK